MRPPKRKYSSANSAGQKQATTPATVNLQYNTSSYYLQGEYCKMKQTMSLSDFKFEIDPCSYNRIIFCTGNQKRFPSNISTSLHYHKIDVFDINNSICLKGLDNTLIFSRILYIEYDHGSSALGDIITIICGEKIPFVKREYTLIAR